MKKNNVDIPETVNVYSLIAEYVGMFIFITIVLMHSENPIAIGIGLTAVIFCFGNISGGHFNPVITVTSFLNNKLTTNTFLLYLLAQFLGGITAWYFIKHWTNRSTSISEKSYPAVSIVEIPISKFPTSSSVGLTPSHSTTASLSSNK